MSSSESECDNKSFQSISEAEFQKPLSGRSFNLCLHDFWWVQLSKVPTEEWGFTGILDQLHWDQIKIILDFSHSKQLFFHMCIIVPIKKLHNGMNENLFTTILQFTRSISDYRAWILLILPQHQLHKQLELDKASHLWFGKCLDNDICISFSSYWKYILWDISGLHLFCFAFVGIVSLGAYKTSWDQQICSGLFLPHSFFQLMNFQHITGPHINS